MTDQDLVCHLGWSQSVPTHNLEKLLDSSYARLLRFYSEITYEGGFSGRGRECISPREDPHGKKVEGWMLG